MKIPDQFIAEHTELRTEIDRLRAALPKNDAPALTELLNQLRESVRRHFRHEDVFYRILDNDKRVSDRGAMHQIRNDHAAVIFSLESLSIRLRKSGPTAEWKAKLENLLGILLPHFEHEETKIFTEAKQWLTPAEMESIIRELTQDE